MLSTPKSLRFHIGLFGRRNAGKSALLNALAGQPVSLVSPQPGTTTDPVQKAMELRPLGPVCFVDTAGLDDEGELGGLRMERTRKVLAQVDCALIVTDRGEWGPWEEALRMDLRARQIPFLVVRSKCDLASRPEPVSQLEPVLDVSAVSGAGVEVLLETLGGFQGRLQEPRFLADLLGPGELAVLVMPIDSEAPKGRLILPQAMAVRDLLDAHALALVVQEGELGQALAGLRQPPRLVVTDSQAFLEVAAQVPAAVPMTSFSILMSRFHGDLAAQVQGLAAIEALKDGDRILVAEGCTHHPTGEDIGRVKIPRWLTSYTGARLEFEHVQGRDFPADPGPYALVVHCGNCMGTRREMLGRLQTCRAAGVPVTNYGLAIAYSLGILDRALAPFPEALEHLHAARV
jgi:[FeFe] hydrogenase H-cluster maturation GTPase HydF